MESARRNNRQKFEHFRLKLSPITFWKTFNNPLFKYDYIIIIASMINNYVCNINIIIILYLSRSSTCKHKEIIVIITVQTSKRVYGTDKCLHKLATYISRV